MNLSGSLRHVSTPALVLERPVLANNLSRMSRRASRMGVALRPHIKTAKCHEVAQLASRGHPAGLAVSTLREAEYFAEKGWKDLLYAVTVSPDKGERVAAIQRNTQAVVALLTDNLSVVESLARLARETRLKIALFIEIDCGDHRSGVAPESDLLLALGRAIARAPGLSLSGVLTHAGHSYEAAPEEVASIAEEERRAAVLAARRLRQAGLGGRAVSVGSTPTALAAEDWQGVSEIRPGNYMFFDLAMLNRGWCRVEDIAVTVLSSVIAHQVEQGHVLLDAGALALSKDLSANGGSLGEVGYGLVPAAGGLPDLIVSSVSQEQGRLRARDGSQLPFDRLPIGARVRILPNHSCLTCAAHQRYVVVEGDQIVAEWERVNGW